MYSKINRRAFLGLAVSGVSVAIAGCSGGSGEGTTDDSENTTAGGSDETATDGGEGTSPEENTGEYTNGVGEDASVSFDVPADGTEVNSRYLQWSATGAGVDIEESGEVNDGAGHHHIMVDTDPVTPGEAIPNDDQHIHYGTGQTDGVLELEPGDHTLHLQVADGAHTAMALTDTVDVTVSEEASLDLDLSAEGSVVDWEVTAENYTIEPSSEGINSNAGHLHAIIDADHVEVGEVIPTDERHMHFGDGSTSGSIDLADQLGDDYEPGEYKIHFQVGTGTHRATMVHDHSTVTTE